MTDTATVTDPLALRAATAHLAARAFAYPSDAQRAELAGLGADLADALTALDATLAARVAGLTAAAAAGEQRDHEAAFNRLFGGDLDVAPHETAYEADVFRRQRAMADLNGFCAAFGLQLPEASRWQADHVGVQMELAAILLQRQALAEDAGLDEQAGVCARALRDLLDDHLGRWHRLLADELRQRAVDAPMLQAAGEVVEAWVDRELRAHALRPVPLAGRRRTPTDHPAPECGGCPAVAPPAAGR